MPPSSQSPETPVPVPISTTVRAASAAASTRSAAPTPCWTGTQPSSSARARARSKTSSSSMNPSAYAQVAGFCPVMAASLFRIEDWSPTLVREPRRRSPPFTRQCDGSAALP